MRKAPARVLFSLEMAGIEADGRNAKDLAFRTRRAREEAGAIDRREQRRPGDEDSLWPPHEKGTRKGAFLFGYG